MSYEQRLQPWVIVRLLPNMQRIIVQRFRRRSEAENYIKALHRIEPRSYFVIVFDVALDEKPVQSKA